ncbi:3'-5' exonuclease [Nodosilinea sp. LEGE 07088]|uniref:3'-5' exonuclease n=1 Tax=Nodosilinea sp. LEGE 07088 TaxID=2777968 RepID=UPI00187E96B4|nr:3'-5' exonuclease [Nodosilinea sp. LEGE 07088]MBE9137157.1 3'-5' exonuclease [Nodosilinea sp. LEGE 07088]
MTIFVALDFETADRYRDSACAIGLVRVEQGQVVDKVHYLIRPPRSGFEFTHIHGITWAQVADQPDFAELWPQIATLLAGADFFAAHNAPFDRSVLYACCRAYGLLPPTPEFVCTVKLARQAWNIRPTKLPDVCAYLGIALNHHDALSDAEACAQIAIASALGSVKSPLKP